MIGSKCFFFGLEEVMLTWRKSFKALNDVGWYGSGRHAPCIHRRPTLTISLAYLLTTCAFQLFFGKLYTFFSIKYVYLTAIFIFEIGSGNRSTFFDTIHICTEDRFSYLWCSTYLCCSNRWSCRCRRRICRDIFRCSCHHSICSTPRQEADLYRTYWGHVWFSKTSRLPFYITLRHFRDLDACSRTPISVEED